MLLLIKNRNKSTTMDYFSYHQQKDRLGNQTWDKKRQQQTNQRSPFRVARFTRLTATKANEEVKIAPIITKIWTICTRMVLTAWGTLSPTPWIPFCGVGKMRMDPFEIVRVAAIRDQVVVKRPVQTTTRLVPSDTSAAAIGRITWKNSSMNSLEFTRVGSITIVGPIKNRNLKISKKTTARRMEPVAIQCLLPEERLDVGIVVPRAVPFGKKRILSCRYSLALTMTLPAATPACIALHPICPFSAMEVRSCEWSNLCCNRLLWSLDVSVSGLVSGAPCHSLSLWWASCRPCYPHALESVGRRCCLLRWPYA
mmetsp:Transcript_21841/g.54009  ORF Transcript_21841/g.54009 Transcript_21841/m.54009 type:complete len:311 (-) Transcript_21841:248-1180(-)